ncbi:MAG: hydroxyacid dehydrogenase [Ktedonobacteraceae bacterium]|nr:hydroxyacid dehydrogenase [Ktedonobacteraceae bacterium]
MPQAHIWTNLPLQPDALAFLEGLASVHCSTLQDQDDWYKEAAAADALIVSGRTTLTGKVMDRIGPRLRIIGRAGIGVDRIDLDAATRRGIMVINTPDGPTESTAEHAIALLLNLCKQVMIGDRLLRAGQPFPRIGELRPGLETAGAILGLVGLGRIGSRVAAIAQALGMQVLAYDPFVTPAYAAARNVELLPSLAELLPRSQVVSLHCPALPQTRHIINAETLKLMPAGSYLINVARGTLIDEDALLAALRSGHLAGAALDVFDPEPPRADHPLFSHPHTICTPHMGSYTTAGQLRMQMMVCTQIKSALLGERPDGLVNPAVWDQRR